MPLGEAAEQDAEAMFEATRQEGAAAENADFARMIFESEAMQLQEDRRKFRILVHEAQMVVQHLESHNRLLQHLLLQERGAGLSGPQLQPPGQRVQTARYRIKARPALNIIREILRDLKEKDVPRSRRFEPGMHIGERYNMLEDRASLKFVAFWDGHRDAAMASSVAAAAGTMETGDAGPPAPVLTRTAADPDPTDLRLQEEEESESEGQEYPSSQSGYESDDHDALDDEASPNDPEDDTLDLD